MIENYDINKIWRIFNLSINNLIFKFIYLNKLNLIKN